MLSVEDKPFMWSVIMMNVIMLGVVMLNVIMLGVVMLSVSAPLLIQPQILLYCFVLFPRLKSYLHKI